MERVLGGQDMQVMQMPVFCEPKTSPTAPSPRAGAQAEKLYSLDDILTQGWTGKRLYSFSVQQIEELYREEMRPMLQEDEVKRSKMKDIMVEVEI
jgi:hypothetical protein